MGIFPGPRELSILYRCPYYRDARNERFDCSYLTPPDEGGGGGGGDIFSVCKEQNAIIIFTYS